MSNKLIHKISSYPTIVIMVGALLAVGFLDSSATWIYETFKEYIGDLGIGERTEFFNKYGIVVEIISVSIIAPLFETFFVQWLPIYLLCKIKNISYWIPIIVSSVIFGIGHNYSIMYAVVMLITGFIFASLFVILKVKKSYSFAFWMVALLHSVLNLIMCVLDQFGI